MISRTLRELMTKGSAIRKMWTEGLRLKEEHGPSNVADLTLGNPLLPPPPELTAVLREVVAEGAEDLHRYTPNAGHPAFRAAVAGHLDAAGILPGARGEHIIGTAGASAATNVALRTLLDPGDEVVYLAPHFPDYPAHILNFSGVPVAARVGADLLPDVDEVERVLTVRTRAVIVNHPNNPTGRQYPENRLRALADLLVAHGERIGRPVFLISDEPYREIRFTAEPFASPARLTPYGLMAYSWSKSLSLPGERIGYLAVNPECPGAEELTAAFALANRVLGFTNAPALWQRVLTRCPGACVDLAPYARHRERLLGALRERGYTVREPEGTFYLFPETPGGDDEAFIGRAMKDLLLLVPGGTFGWPGHFRMAYCTDDHTVDLAVDRLPPAV